jgi:CheY-like chemotaxis protein
VLSIIEEFRHCADAKGLVLSLSGMPSIEGSFDLAHLKRILTNLVSNAIKYTDVGKIEIIVTKFNKAIRISVKDSGIGIPKSIRPDDIFKQFQRLSNASDRQGVGLGLAISKVLAELNEGKITFEHNTGPGVTFHLTLPMFEGELAKVRDFGLLKHHSNQNVLVLDDDNATRNVLSKYIEGEGFKTRSVVSLDSAEYELETGDYALLVADFYLKDGNILPLLDKIPPSTKVLVCSGAANLESRYPGLKKNGISVIEKPVERDTLSLAVKGCFGSASKSAVNDVGTRIK